MINITLSLIPDMTFLGAPYKTNDEICCIVWTDIRSSVTVTVTATECCSLNIREAAHGAKGQTEFLVLQE